MQQVKSHRKSFIIIFTSLASILLVCSLNRHKQRTFSKITEKIFLFFQASLRKSSKDKQISSFPHFPCTNHTYSTKEEEKNFRIGFQSIGRHTQNSIKNKSAT